MSHYTQNLFKNLELKPKYPCDLTDNMNGHSEVTNGKPNGLKTFKEDSGPEFIAPGIQKTNSWVTRNKLLSPAFSNVKDEAELGKMMGDDGERLLDLVDDIRKIDSLRNEELHIPQVCPFSYDILTTTDQKSRLW